jgi:hypothetical protein
MRSSKEELPPSLGGRMGPISKEDVLKSGIIFLKPQPDFAIDANNLIVL